MLDVTDVQPVPIFPDGVPCIKGCIGRIDGRVMNRKLRTDCGQRLRVRVADRFVFKSVSKSNHRTSLKPD